MKPVLLIGMLACIAASVAAGLAGAPVLAFSAAFGGLALVGVAAEHSRPSRWTPAENEHRRGDED